MSRSALTRHALHKSVALRANGPADGEATERHVKNDELAVHGNDTTYNLNTLLHQNIVQSPYFHELYKFRTYHEVVDEIYYRVDHAEPFAPGTARMPSTCFCLLFKCFTMRFTVKQMQGVLKHEDSPYIRAVGFLYLRYTIDPEELWNWFEPYLEDTEEFNASANPNIKTTIGNWLIQLLEENNYFGTILPRIPKKIQDNIKVKLLLHGRRQERARENLAIVSQLKPGTKIRAFYEDDDNPPAMYDAVIDSVEENNEFWVTFPEYGNTEKIRLGDIEFESTTTHSSSRPSRSRSRSSSRRDRGEHGRGTSRSRSSRHDRSRRSRSRSLSQSRSRGRSRRRHHHSSRSRSRSRDRSRRSRRHRSRSRSRSPSTSRGRGAGGSSSMGARDLADDLLAQVREQERRKAAAVGKDYAARPASYKGSLSLKLDRYTTRKRSPTKRNDMPSARARSRSASRGTSRATTSASPPSDKPGKSTEASQEAQERMRKLRAMYGDASVSTEQD